MAFDHISGAEPSTVTFKAATIKLTRNSSGMHQELITLADPVTVLGVARILDSAPASTEYGLAVRQVGFSTVVSVANQVRVSNSTAADFLASVAQASTVWQVQVGGYSTIISVANQVRVANSTAGDFLASVAQASTVWQVQVGGYSTIAAVSSLAGRVTVAPTDTNWASSAGFHFNSAGDLKVDASALPSVSASTVTSVAASTSSVTLQASNASRKGWSCYNASTSVLYLKLGATASTTSYTLKLPEAVYYELPAIPIYTGVIDGIWDSTNGSAKVTEL